MSRNFACPNCGGEHTLANPGITMLVCSYCKTVVYWGDDARFRRASSRSSPRPTPGCSCTPRGKLKGGGFQVAGAPALRPRTRHLGRVVPAAGRRRRGLAQRGRARAEPGDATAPRTAPCRPRGSSGSGSSVPLDGVAFTVREVGTRHLHRRRGPAALHHAARRALPLRRPGLAWTASASPRWSTTRATPHLLHRRGADHEQLQRGRRAAPLAPQARHGGKHIKCPNCAAPLEVPRRPRGADPGLRVLRRAARPDRRRGKGAGGQPAGLRSPASVRGRAGAAPSTASATRSAGACSIRTTRATQSREYLLYNPDAGYLWLAEENGPLRAQPPHPAGAGPRPLPLSHGQAGHASDETVPLLRAGQLAI